LAKAKASISLTYQFTAKAIPLRLLTKIRHNCSWPFLVRITAAEELESIGDYSACT